MAAAEPTTPRRRRATPLHGQIDPPTHLMRRDDYFQHYGSPLWLGVRLSGRKVEHASCWIFTDAKTCDTRYASVERVTNTQWLVLLGRTDDALKLTRLSRARWRPTWHVRYVCVCAALTPYYDAIAIGDSDRAEQILRATYGKDRMPEPVLPAGVVVPTLVKLSRVGAV